MHSTIETAPSTEPEVAPDPVAPEVYHAPPYPYKGYDLTSYTQNSETPRKNEIAGLRKPTFWLLIALFSVVALSLGLGTGLGLGLKNNNVNNTGAATSESDNMTSSPHATTTSSSTTSESTSTSTSTSSTSAVSTAAAPTSTGVQDSGCPNRNGNTISKTTLTYKISCNSDLTGSDLASLVVNSLEECISMCDSLNWTQKRKDVGSVWNEEGVIGQTAGTCWCKGGDKIQVTSKPGIVVASPLPQS
ncbi:hypothetical protein F5Y04DRAFT_256431 [Hypomontagnella monticulosa]|nr:hypothetical protein F5Y04DRAFT_256431 [Hypomontagnella monticulosa]